MKYLGIIVFALITLSGFSQENNELPFINHLINKGYFNEAIYLMGKNNLPYGQQQRDSFNYFLGWAHYSVKDLEQSTTSLLKVGKESPFYFKSHFFAAYNQIYLENYSDAHQIFRQMNIQQEPNLSLLNFEQAGMKMLQENWQEAQIQIKQINTGNASLSQQVVALTEIYKEHEAHRSKSPVVAGVMSGIIPGSGKIYAGKTGSGIASMLGSAGLGFITWENYRKGGISNAKTIIFGSIFAVNYVANIYGSVISVKIIENEYTHNIHNQILFQLHIPLRNFFD